MAAKKKSFLNREVDPTTESIALGSAFSVLFLMFVKSLVLAVTLGVALALAHLYSRKQSTRKK